MRSEYAYALNKIILQNWQNIAYLIIIELQPLSNNQK
jgi:hypothetical protein